MKNFIFASILLTTLLTIAVCTTAQNLRSNTKAWENIDQLIENNLPESALKALDSISRIAYLNKDKQENIKVKLYEYRIETDKNPDKIPAIILDFEQFTNSFEASAEKQLLFCMVAEMYYNYYQKNKYKFDRRTDVAGNLPDNPETWSKNHYQQKVKFLLEKVWEEQAILRNTDISSLKSLFVFEVEIEEEIIVVEEVDEVDFLIDVDLEEDIAVLAIEKDKKTEKLNTTPTLFDYIAYKIIDLSDSFNDEKTTKEIYRELIQFRKDQGDEILSVLAELSYMNYLFYESNSETYLQKIDSLEQVYQNSPAVIEILVHKANYYLDQTEMQQHKNLAYNICKRGIEIYPDYPRIGLLKNILAQIEQQTFTINSASEVKPSSQLKMNIHSTNISEITLEVYRLNTTPKAFAKHKLNKNIDQQKDILDKVLIQTLTINLSINEYFEPADTTIFIQTGDYGIYEYIAYTTGKREKDKMISSYFTVTDFTFIQRAISEDKIAYYVVDRITGKRIKNVDIESYEFKWNGNEYEMTPFSAGKTNSKGYAELTKMKSFGDEIILLKRKVDCFFSIKSFSPYFSTLKPTEKIQQRINIFTDRAIYRPGQTVYFKAIAYEFGKEKQEVSPRKNFKFELIDTNGNVISTKNLTTNEFGSASGEFVLPSGGLNGNYQIRAENKYSENFLVEEYKRPTFEVTVTKPSTEISFGDEVTLDGAVKAYAGYQLPGVQVKYVINRYVHPFWRWFPPIHQKTMVESGVTTTDANGKFSVSFVPEKDKYIFDRKAKQSYRYTVTIDATDSKGETQQAITHIAVSEQSLFILAEIPELIDKQDTTKLKVSTQNIAGEKIHKTIRYEIYSLFETTDYQENMELVIDPNLDLDEVFRTDKKIEEGLFDTQSNNLKLNLNKYKSGRYKIIFTTDDKLGNPVESKHIFILYDQKDTRPPVKTYAWLLNSRIESTPGEKVNIQFGTSVKCAHVLIEVMHGNEVISSRWIRMNNTISTFSIPFAKRYKSGISVNFTFVRDEQLIQRTVSITEKVQERKLTPKLTVFRDKLLPGESATWTINIPEVAAKGKIAELLAGMYDASLDAIRSHDWNFNPVYRTPFSRSSIWTTYHNQNNFNPIYIQNRHIDVPVFFSPTVNWFGLEFGYQIMIGATRSKSNRNLMTGETVFAMNVIAEDDVVLFRQAVISDETTTQPIQPPRIRTNFDETAFFYPHLQCDSLGNYQFSFTMPESLTSWNLKMLAHTKDLYFGQADAQVITQQDLMVQLNMPRFVRQSDIINLHASLVNLSEKPLQASVKLTFIDPTTNQIVLLNDTNAVEVDLPADGTPLALAWDVKGFEKHELLICKIVATAGAFSDGEQKYLAVLPDKVLVTESFPVSISSGAEKQFTFENMQELADKVETRQLTFEFSANPVWYAIQALPALAEPKSENAVDYFIAWYVCNLAGKILADNPRIKEVFEQIKLTDPNTLQSALFKNQELKNILLEETPWLTEAKDETEQQQRIALLFDLNQQQQLKSRYLEKLKKLQLPSGAFTWFEGMGESRWVTQFIAEGLLKARSYTDINIINRMLGPALNYLESQITNDYLQLKKQVKDYDKKMNISSFQLHFLSLRTQVNAPEISADSKEAMEFYFKQTEQYHTKFNLYDKALAAGILHRTKKTVVVDAILKSLKENALHTEEMGMYWAKNTSGYFWNERPVSVHVKLMEAFNLVRGNETELAAMKIWLLRQKQTQLWDSPVSSVNAIYALTGIGKNLLNNPQAYTITAGTKTFDTNKGMPGTGYIKQNLMTEEVKNGIIIRRVNQTAEASPAWGALYWQYYQDMDEVRSSGSVLKVNKQLFVERIVDNRKTIFPINGQNVLAGKQNINTAKQIVKKGDKIITRMVVTTDHNLEFVALKDNRAANLEPVNQLSGCSWKEQVVYYRTVKDASTQYFFNHLPKGTYVFEDEYYVNASGNFSGGTASIQCLYAPEFNGVSKGERVETR